ncbi:ribonuclease III [Candidatus Phytoplasma palmae]|uniref:ribonuclease III n=1 Tax=Candidatus Phytoplasma palmae TaxID=85624 RepID=UPI0039907277
MPLQKLFQRLKIEPKNISLYINALTHSSYANESPFQNNDNERLEFLGDAVINFLMANYLYRKNKYDEGSMTKKRAQAVCIDSLLIYANEIDLKEYILLGKGEQKRYIHNYSIIADAFEALFGAIYLDLGYEQVKKTFYYVVLPCLNKIIKIIDYKTQLQEIVQAEKQTIHYKIIEETGLAHEKEFIAEVYLNNKLLGSGTGKTKKSAEQRAAQKALNKISLSQERNENDKNSL